MSGPESRRRLMAILVGDVVGYSRLMEIDEAGTLARLRVHRLELVDPAISKNAGRIIKTTGDGMLVEFASVVDAVACALEIQIRMARRNADVDPDHRMRFRLGINIGDVIVEGDDVFGDGVNIAARLEQLAEPGGICVSDAVREQLGNKLDVAFEDMGEQHVKNIARPIRTFRVALDEVSAAKADVPVSRPTEEVEPPSIAVLPFTNMSGDPDQEFFVDGLTEDILTELSRFKEFIVISRNSTFVYKGKAVNVQEVARSLNAKYVVEGSVRKAGNRVRITVQLIDAERDKHIWAERFDRDLEDIFAIQDEVTSSIAATLPGRLEAASQDRIKRKTPDNMAAYELVMAAKVLHHRSAQADNKEAQELIDLAIAIDPDYAHAHAWKACILGQAWTYDWCEDRDATWQTALTELETASAQDENDADMHRIQAAVHLAGNDHEGAAYHQERGLALNPNYDLIVVQQGELYTWLGEPEKGIEWVKKAMRLNPHHPERFWSHLGRAYFVARRYGEAVDAFRRISRPDAFHHAFLAACAAMQGEEDAAGAHAQNVLAAKPDFSVSAYLDTLHYKLESDRAHHHEALLKAGLPE